MIENQQTSLISEAEALKSQVLQIREKIDAQEAIISEEKTKGPRADKGKMAEARRVLTELRPQVDAMYAPYSKFARKTDPAIVSIIQPLQENFTGVGFMDDRIDNLLREVTEVEAAIPGIDSAADAAAMVEKIAGQEDQTPTEQLVVYLYKQVEALRAELAARPVAAPTTPVAPTEEGTTPAPAATEAEAEHPEEDIIDKMIRKGQEWWTRLRTRTPNQAKLDEKELKTATRVVKDTLGKDFSVVLGILEDPTKVPEGRVERATREAQLYPILAVLEANGVIVLTETAKRKVDQDYADDRDNLVRQLEIVGRNNKTGLLNLMTWARRNMHRLQALPEVVGAAPEPAAAPASPEPAPTVANPAPVATPEANPAAPAAAPAAPEPPTPPAAPAEAQPPAPATQEKDKNFSKKLKELYDNVRQQIPANAAEDVKVNAITLKPTARPRVLGNAYRIFNDVVTSKAQAFDAKNVDNVQGMKLLLVCAEVDSFYDSLTTKPYSKAEIKALVDKIATL